MRSWCGLLSTSDGPPASTTISASLQGVMGQVDSTAGSMQMHLQGLSGSAAQAAFVRYQEAAQVQKAALDEISANIHTGGVQYVSTDEDQGVHSEAFQQDLELGAEEARVPALDDVMVVGPR